MESTQTNEEKMLQENANVNGTSVTRYKRGVINVALMTLM
jgi:hypothetical protein